MALLAAGCWLSGYASERIALRARSLGVLRAPARLALGAGLWIALTFALAAAGALRIEAIATAAVCVGLAAVGARARWPDSGESHTPSDAVFLGALALCAMPFLGLALSPEITWDAGTYHLALPKRFLAAGGFVPIEMNVYSNWPLGTELLFAVAMLVQDYVLAKLVHLGFGLATLWVVYCGCRAFHGPRGRASGWLAAALVLANATFQFELGVAYVDLAVSFFLLCGVLFSVRALEEEGPKRRAWLLLAGLCGGALASTKVSGIASAAALGLVVLPAALSQALRGRPALLREAIVCLGLPTLLLWAPWLFKAAAYTGNPVYPFFYDFFGGADWSPVLSGQFSSWQRSIGMGRELADWLALPGRVILTHGGGYDRFHGDIGDFWIVLIPLAAGLGIGHRIVRGCLTAAAFVFAIWAVGSQQMRLLLPILPLLAIASAITCVDVVWRIPSSGLRRVGLALAPLAAIALAAHTGAASIGRGFDALTGGESQGGPRAVHRYVATALPESARLLLLDTNQVFFLERDALADSFFEASQIADWLGSADTPDAVLARLRERRITHVLRSSRRWGIEWPPALLTLLEDRNRAVPRFRAADGRDLLLELR